MMKTKKIRDPNRFLCVEEGLVVSINKDDSSKFDISSGRLKFINDDDPNAPIISYKDIKAKFGIEVEF